MNFRKSFVRFGPKQSCFAIALFLFSTVLCDSAHSEDGAGSDALVAVQVDLGKFATSEIGRALINAGTAIAAEEMGKDPDEAMKALIKSIGFDPVEQKVKLTAIIANPEDPIEGLALQLTLKNTTGNLEGLLLVAPGYRSEKSGSHTIHTISPENDEENIHIGFATVPSGERHIIVSGDRADVANALDAIGSAAKAGVTAWEMPAGQFVNVKLLSLPDDLMEELSDETPFGGIFQLLESTSLSIGEEGTDLVFRLQLASKEDEKAQQLQQLAQGAVAMVTLFKEEIQEELDDAMTAKSVVSVLEKTQIHRDGSEVMIQANVPIASVMQFLREEADLPL